MSNLILPSLPGVKINVRRKPMWSTSVQTSVSGREQRASWWSHPRYRYALQFEFLRSAAAYREFQALAGFLARHAGQYDTFLFSDPEDNAVSDHGFGVGDGSKTAFQLQRTLGGDSDDELGDVPAYTKPRTNRIVRSTEFENASWSKSFQTVLANVDIAPDGTGTARKLVEDATTTSRYIVQATTPQEDDLVVGSVWAKAGERQHVYVRLRGRDNIYKGIVANLSTGVAAPEGGVTSYGMIPHPTLPGWYRCWLAYPTGKGSTQSQILITTHNGSSSNYLGDGRSGVYIWGAQVEYGEGATAPTPYIATAASAVTWNPSYWPAKGSGFEPVYELAPDLQVFRKDWQGTRRLYPWARTNLVIRSQEFDNAAWTKSNSSATANATAAPDGTTTAEKIVESAANAQHYWARDLAAVADYQVVTAAFWAKAAERTVLGISIKTKADTYPYGQFDLVNGVASTPGTAPLAVGMIQGPNGWWLCWVAASVSSGGATPAIFGYVVNGSTIYTGDGTSGLYAWGAQAEAVPAVGAPGVYIPTTTAAVTVTDYTLGATGLVTLAAAPVAGAVLSWTGSYYRRVRCASDEVEAERIVNAIWETKTLELISVKPGRLRAAA